MQFSTRERTECEGCQQGENSIALGHSKRKNAGQMFLFCNMWDTKYPCICKGRRLLGMGVHHGQVREIGIGVHRGQVREIGMGVHRGQVREIGMGVHRGQVREIGRG